MIVFFIDAIAVLVSVLLAIKIRFGTVFDGTLNQNTTIIFALLSVLFFIYLTDLYVRYVYVSRLKLFFKVVRLWGGVLVLYITIAFITKHTFLIDSRIFIVFYHTILLILLLVSKLAVIPYIFRIKYLRRKIPCVFIGSENCLEDIDKFFAKNSLLGLTRYRKTEGREPKEFFIVSETNDFGELYDLIRKYLKKGYPVHVASFLFNELNLKWEWGCLNRMAIYTFRLKKESPLYRILRRAVDIVVAILLIIILGPLFLIIAIAIKFDSRGPVIYKQKRCGAGAKEFILYKFRSMIYSNNEKENMELISKKYLRQKADKEKLIDKRAITFVGSILRRTSLDELPQLINVLKGDMSLIGPRPPIPYEVKHYHEWHRDRFLVKPGLTGLWQVYARGTMPCDSSIFLDLVYIINRSLSLDLKIMLKTIPMVLLGRGAY